MASSALSLGYFTQKEVRRRSTGKAEEIGRPEALTCVAWQAVGSVHTALWARLFMPGAVGHFRALGGSLGQVVTVTAATEAVVAAAVAVTVSAAAGGKGAFHGSALGPEVGGRLAHPSLQLTRAAAPRVLTLWPEGQDRGGQHPGGLLHP